ncbi:MAG: threonine-phosphate decarboxylase CobD [Burkholderiales bacterium]|nr:threonine-phosphate decarboxylase CobD [Burkholderiales bacterium]
MAEYVMLQHGGQIRAAAARYGIAVADWLDLSTGINPIPFIPPEIPLTAWARLPQEQDGLEEVASRYYGTSDLLPAPGSQAGIQLLPRLRCRCRVGVLHPGYAEHAHAWRNAGHEVQELHAGEISAQIDNLDVLVLMQPNNPSGEVFTNTQLHEWHTQLAARGGWLIVDEAFIEASVQTSFAPPQMPHGLIVLRSLGKFFGLAGARVGFVLAHSELLGHLRAALGPWSVAGPSRFMAQAALLDHAWQEATRARLLRDGARLAQLLSDAGLPPAGGCGLFQWVLTEQAKVIHQQLAQHGIFTRLFPHPRSLRFGLPGSAAEWSRLSAALKQIHSK